jgi:hypothetical protein
VEELEKVAVVNLKLVRWLGVYQIYGRKKVNNMFCHTYIYKDGEF